MSAAIGAAGWLHMNNRIARERKDDQERTCAVVENDHLQPEQPQPRSVTVTYRKRKVLEHA